jgi:hypothetical protein
MTIRLPWDPAEFRRALQGGPQRVTIRGASYLYYSEVTASPGAFVGVRDDCHCTFVITPMTETVTEVTPSDSVLSTSAWHVNVGALLARLRSCKQPDTRLAVSQAFTAGIILPHPFCNELMDLLSMYANNEAAVKLQERLAAYGEDLQGSARLRATCAEALDFLRTV